MKQEKGITIIVLIITIIVMMILLGITISSGGDTLKTAELQSFVADCEIIQSKVDVIYEKLKLDSNYLTDRNIGNSVQWQNDEIQQNLNISNLSHKINATINFSDGTVNITPDQTDYLYGQYFWENGKAYRDNWGGE